MLQTMLEALEKSDSELSSIITAEAQRQEKTICLIASENIISLPVKEALGSVLSNKYAEGYPGHRYYEGCTYIDEVERLCQERLCSLFGAEYANVQPHSGTQANLAAYSALLEPGDSMLSMSLSAGGHLSHGTPLSLSSSLYEAHFYGVDPETEQINYDEVQNIAEQVRPKLIVAGASAYPRFIDFARFRQIADGVGAQLMVDMAHIAGLIAAGVHPSPVPYADIITSTTHKTLRGPRGAIIIRGKDAPNKRGKTTKSGKVRLYSSLINSAVFPGMQGGPLMHVIAAKAAAFGEDLQPEFKEYQKQVLKNCKTLGETLVKQGLRLVSGGSDNHLMLVDLTNFGLYGSDAEKWLAQAGIVCNKNMIPGDQYSPKLTSGIRLGTPLITSRGAKEGEMQVVGEAIAQVLTSKGDKEIIKDTKKSMQELALSLPGRRP